MASRIPRRRRARPDPEVPAEPEEDVSLDADEHAWWAQRDISERWTPREAPAPPEDPAKARDILADHFGADWRTSFGFEPPRPDPTADHGAGSAPEPAGDVPDPDEPVDDSDPYAVLGIDQRATWEEIVDAHRRLARRHHPDRLVGRAPAERDAGEDRIRVINIAYQELRVRRGR